MKILFAHPSALLYSNIYLRLEPIGLELVAQAARYGGHEVQLIDLQVETQKVFFKIFDSWHPDVLAISCSYLANVPEVIDLAKASKKKSPEVYIIVGGHSASFIPEDLLEHSEGTIDCILKGEGEAAICELLRAIDTDKSSIHQVPGVVTTQGIGPAPGYVESLDNLFPARDLLRKPRKYFSAVLDPCASIEMGRGCPWDCSFCSAWTFYGRKYRLIHPEKVIEDLERIDSPGVFIVDDVAFVHPEHAIAIAEEILRKGIKKKFYLETRGDVLLRNLDAFEYWKKAGLKYMFLGLEAIDEEGLEKYRKRMTLGENFEALEAARSLGIRVAVNIIADPDWDEKRFETVRQWSQESPEIVNISVYTPYPGTEAWLTDKRELLTRDYRLFDLLHTVLRPHLPLTQFYEELVKTQQIMNNKFLGPKLIKDVGPILLRNLLRGQTNFLSMVWSFNASFNTEQQLAHHKQNVVYELKPPPGSPGKFDRKKLYVLNRHN
jgi:hopanoid C-3 methylase HpnR